MIFQIFLIEESLILIPSRFHTFDANIIEKSEHSALINTQIKLRN